MKENNFNKRNNKRSFGESRDGQARSGQKSERPFKARNVRERRAIEKEEREDDGFENVQLEGRNAVLEALNHDKTIDKILVKAGEIEGTLKVIISKAREKRIIVQEVTKHRLDEVAQSHNHQGVIAVCPSHEYAEVQDILDKAKEKDEAPFIIILDSITDPHNLGAILRTADACGAHGVIIPKRRAVGLTGIVSKTSAGAIEHVLVARVVNIARTIDDLKKQNIWIASGESEGQTMYKAPLDGAIAIVIGNEGDGVGKLISEKCDYKISIPMFGEIESLNASVAAGLFMYEVVRQRKFQ